MRLMGVSSPGPVFVYIIGAEAFHTDNSTEDLNAHYIETG